MNQEQRFHRLKALVAFEIDSFCNSIAKLRSSHFPSPSAGGFLDALLKLADDQKLKVIRSVDVFPDDPKGAIDRLQSLHRKLCENLSLLGVIENARTDDVPWSVVPSVERIASKLLPDHQIVTTSVNEFTFSIRQFDEYSGLDEFLLLKLPKIHKSNALLHVLVGHELFHPILEGFFDQHTSATIKRLKDVYHPHVLKEYGKEEPGLFNFIVAQRLDEVVEDGRNVWRRALEEVMCDFGCSAIFGPAAILGLSTIALTMDYDELPNKNGDFYPPWRYRLRAVMKYVFESKDGSNALEELKKALSDKFAHDARNLQSHFDTMTTAVALHPDRDEIDKHWLLKAAYQEVDKSLGVAWEYIRGRAAVIKDVWMETVTEVPSHLSSFGLLVPPSELRVSGKRGTTPSSTSAIATATWLVQLRQERPDAPAGDPLINYHRNCRLMLKALEDVDLIRSFDEYCRSGENLK